MADDFELSLVDLKRNFNDRFLREFYSLIQVEIVGLSKEELINYEEIKEGTCSQTRQMYTDVVVSKRTGIGITELPDVDVVGGINFVFFPRTNCGYINYIAVRDKYRGKGGGKQLMSSAIDKFKTISKENGHPENSVTIYLESHRHNGNLDAQYFLYRSGFRKIEFAYVMPPFAVDMGPSYNLWLTVYKPELIPNYLDEGDAYCGEISSRTVDDFVEELFQETYGEDMESYKDKDCYIEMKNSLQKSEELVVNSCFPWTDSKGFFEEQVVVIGGGVAGLTAAAELSKQGIHVVLLEASDYLGGRVKQICPFKGFSYVDVGGEFIHGENTLIKNLADTKGWGYEKMFNSESPMGTEYLYANGKLMLMKDNCKEFLQAFDTLNDFFECGRCLRRYANIPGHTWDPLLPHEDDTSTESETDDKIRKEFEKTGLKDQSLLSWLKTNGITDNTLCSSLDSLFCQTDGTCMSTMGMLEGSRVDDCWDYGKNNYRLKGSYRILLDHLLDQCRYVDKRLNWPVKEINWTESGPVSIKNKVGESLEANHVIVTVPLTILKDGDIEFIPDLPSWKQNAIQRKEMQGAFKIICRFRSPFWPDNFNLLYCAEGFCTQIWREDLVSDETGETCHVLLGFSTAGVAEKASKLGEEAVKEKFLQQLDTIFGTEEEPNIASSNCVGHFFYDWLSHPFIRGGYSSPAVGAYGMTTELAKPVGNKLFFAGEATHITVNATVQSAMDSGFRVAKEVSSIFLDN